ncbi:MAG: hypothetical protein D6692_13260 [Planctomycetota bacterium]|nr:MAG: hypothetical protein D6692_13260 [Planctomycetota bacterium]
MTEIRYIMKDDRQYVFVREIIEVFSIDRIDLDRWTVAGFIESPVLIDGEPAYEATVLDQITLVIRWTRHLGMDEMQIKYSLRVRQPGSR